MRLGVADQLGDALRGYRQMDDQHVRHGGDHSDRGEVAPDIVWNIAVEKRIDGEISGRRQHQRVAIGRRLGAEFHPDVPSGTGAIVDDDGFAQAAG